MKDTIINNITSVIKALDGITVSGVNNLINLAGSIRVLEETLERIKQCDIPETQIPG